MFFSHKNRFCSNYNRIEWIICSWIEHWKWFHFPLVSTHNISTHLIECFSSGIMISAVYSINMPLRKSQTLCDWAVFICACNIRLSYLLIYLIRTTQKLPLIVRNDLPKLIETSQINMRWTLSMASVEYESQKLKHIWEAELKEKRTQYDGGFNSRSLTQSIRIVFSSVGKSFNRKWKINRFPGKFVLLNVRQLDVKRSEFQVKDIIIIFFSFERDS